MKTLLLASMLASLVGCGGNAPGEAHLKFNGPTEDSQAILDAVAEWRDVCGFDVTVDSQGDVEVNMNPLLVPPGSAAVTNVFSLGGAEIDYIEPARSMVFAHEIGHVLGLDHVSDPDDLMYPIAHADGHVTPALCRRVLDQAK